jgi:hypothetical protein
MTAPVVAWPEFSSAPRTLREEDATHETWVEELKRLAHTTRTWAIKFDVIKSHFFGYMLTFDITKEYRPGQTTPYNLNTRLLTCKVTQIPKPEQW